MSDTHETEILLVEDNADDREMTLRALRKANLANRVHLARDGAEALEFIFGEGVHAGRPVQNGPKLIRLDLTLPKIDGM
jgi:two-component system response regulator